MMKKIISITAGTGILLLTALPAFAASGCSNSTTGYLSNNTCNVSMTKLKTLILANFGAASHNVTKNVTTGNNGVNMNTSVTGNLAVDTGNASADVASFASGNTANVTVNQTDPSMDLVGTNNVTGSTSNNTINVTNDKTVTANVTNNGTINHSANVRVSTGDNLVQMNTIVGGIRTGMATSNTSLGTVLNDLMYMVNQ